MATLEEILKPTNETDAEHLRGFLKDSMRQVRAEIAGTDAEIARWSAAPLDPSNEALAAERKAILAAHKQNLANLLAKWNSLEARLAALPAPKASGTPNDANS